MVQAVVAVGLQREEHADKAADRRVGEWITHGDIQRLDTWGCGVEYGLQKLFVAEHHCRAVLLIGLVCLEPLGEIACLGVLARRRDDRELSCLLPVAEALGREFIAVTLEVLTDKEACLVALVGLRIGISEIIVPEEEGLSAMLELVEEGLFDIVEYIEAHENKGLAGIGGGIQARDDIALQSAFVQQTVAAHRGIEIIVDGRHLVP